MTHKERELLSAFVDGELTSGERVLVEDHLRGCAECAAELRALRAVKSLAASAPRRPLPPAVLAAFEARASDSFARRLRTLALSIPRRVLIPLGALGALAAGALLWSRSSDRGEISLEPLLAAHARYCAEGLAPQENLVYPEFIADLEAGHAE